MVLLAGQGPQSIRLLAQLLRKMGDYSLAQEVQISPDGRGRLWSCGSAPEQLGLGEYGRECRGSGCSESADEVETQTRIGNQLTREAVNAATFT
jgi:hypothetical protein